MNKKTVVIEIEEFERLSEMNGDDRMLLEKAVDATNNSYAPYSEFHVGAAVLLENGEIITAGNQENAAYPSGLCAERVALFYAKSKYPDTAVLSIAITAKSENFSIEGPLPPCGSCRQVIAETEKRQNKPIAIIMKGEKGPVHKVTGIESLLPFTFYEEKLKKKNRG
jgi:cytidine deaminase